MDPSTNQPVANPNLPIAQPQPEARPSVAMPPVETPAQPNTETAPPAVETTPQPGAAAPVQAAQAQTPLVPAVTPPPAQSVHTGSVQGRALYDPSLVNMEAADEDLIEKEWVDKAEEIITNDEDNPYVEDQHQHDISRVYLKKRFNLDVS